MKLRLLALMAVAVPAFASVDLTVSLGITGGTTIFDPGQSFTLQVAAINLGTESSPATIRVPLPPGSTFLRAEPFRGDWTCAASGDAVVCNGDVPAGPERQFYGFKLTVAAPTSPDGFSFLIETTISSPLPDDNLFNNRSRFIVYGYRVFTVTVPDDGGAGSLRDALAQANDRCDGSVPCKIKFASAMKIEPQTPLPVFRGCGIRIDGEPSAADVPDFNVTRRVEISGAKLNGSGNGLELRCACISSLPPGLPSVILTGLAINGFPENGVLMAPATLATLTMAGCNVGTDVTGTRALPNLSRGVSFETNGAGGVLYRCIISGNGRSGVSVWSGQNVSLSSNLIGVSSTFEPLGNGASGVFTNAGALQTFDNTIAANRHFGIAVGAGAQHAATLSNSIHDNGGIGVDWDLDGPTSAEASGRMPPTPRLTFAFYDAGRNVTVVRGIVPLDGRAIHGTLVVDLFESGPTSAGFGGDQPLQVRAVLPQDATGDAPFELEIRGDKRGRKITAQTLHYRYLDFPPDDSSEYSAALLVP